MKQEQFEILLGVLAEKLQEKDETITLQKWQIEDLEKKLQVAEYYLETANKQEVSNE